VKGDIISGLTAGHKFQNTLDINVPKRGRNTTEQLINQGFDRHSTNALKGTKIFI
jgi:hypothetical protein